MRKNLVIFCLLVGIPGIGFAQFVDKGEYVLVAKGTMLCSNLKLDETKGGLDPGKVFWRVTSLPRANGTQTVSAFVYESVYDRRSGETTTKESRYDDDYATFFKRDPEHKGMLLMISPQDGRVQALVEVCAKRPRQLAGPQEGGITESARFRATGKRSGSSAEAPSQRNGGEPR